MKIERIEKMKRLKNMEALLQEITIDGVKYHAYSKLLFDFAEKWATNMEIYMKEGKSIAECAEQAKQDYGDPLAAILLHNGAVSLLNLIWVHGEDLAKWHNENYCATECPLKMQDHEEKPSEEEKV